MRLKKLMFALLSSGFIFFLGSNYLVQNNARYTTNTLDSLPREHACLVLGTARTLANGLPNRFFSYRIDAATQVYQAGKCRKIVVSGDNRHANYNEPADMKQSLIARGIPASAIICDYAGGRTLDSVVRFRVVFGQSSGIVISQQFHNERAIYLARHFQIELTGFNAPEVDAYNAFKTKFREMFSRALAVLDVEVFHSEPRHYGEPVQI